MKMKSLLFLLFIGLLYSPMAFSQDEEIVEETEQKFTISGSVDAYFHTSLGSEDDAPGTSFAQLPGFGLGMVNLIASYDGKNSGFVADLVFGPRGYDAVFQNDYTGQRIVNQLYAYLKLGDVVTLNLGQFNTFLGYEVISPTVNVNYSTSYMFSYGPFSHTGLRADFAFSDNFGAKLGIMNPTDFVEFNPVDTYTLGAQLGYTSDNGGVWLNFLYGDQDGNLNEELDEEGEFSEGSTFQADLTGGWDLSDMFYLGVNATFRTVGPGEAIIGGDIEDLDGDPSGFYGIAIYPKLTLSESFALGLRAEYFGVKNGYITPFALDGPFGLSGDGNVIALTISGNYSVGNLMIIPEFRIDKTSEDSYFTTDFEDVSDMLATFTLAAVYKF